MEIVTINGQGRTEFGKKANKTLRREGGIPAVMYSKNENIQFSTDHNSVKHLIYTPDFKLAEVEVDGGKHKAFIKDIQFHPVTDKIMHIDFIKLSEGVNVKVDVPVKFKGVSPGIKEGGKLIQSLRKIQIKALPADLVNELEVDISEVELGGSIRVKELEVVEGITVLTDPNIPIAIVEVPRALKSLDDEEAKAEGDAAAAEGDAAAAEGDAAATE